MFHPLGILHSMHLKALINKQQSLPSTVYDTDFFRTGSKSGVLAKARFAPLQQLSLLQRHHQYFCFLSPAFAASLATVKIVPSTGFITALYAVSTP